MGREGTTKLEITKSSRVSELWKILIYLVIGRLRYDC